jgi:hypothetical protein
MRVIVEQWVEWRLAGETEVLGENPPSAILSTKNYKWPDPGSNVDSRVGEPAPNRLSYDTAYESYLQLGLLKQHISLKMKWIPLMKYDYNGLEM